MKVFNKSACVFIRLQQVQVFIRTYLGVRSLLIVKDNKPKWNPDRLEDVTDQHVLSLFKTLPNNEDIRK